MSDPDDYGDLDVQDTLDRLLTMTTIMAMGLHMLKVFPERRDWVLDKMGEAGAAALTNLPPHLKQGLIERLKP